MMINSRVSMARLREVHAANHPSERAARSLAARSPAAQR
jgi:hypothetical protein